MGIADDVRTAIYLKEIQSLLDSVKSGKVEYLKELKRAKVLIDKLVEEA